MKRGMCILLTLWLLLFAGCGPDESFRVDKSCLADFGITYAEAAEKYGVQGSPTSFNGGVYVHFTGRAWAMQFTNGDLTLSSPPVQTDPDGRANMLLLPAGSFFKNHPPTITVAEVEELLGVKTEIVDNQVEGGYVLHFTYEGYWFQIHGLSDKTHFLPTDRMTVMKAP